MDHRLIDILIFLAEQVHLPRLDFLETVSGRPHFPIDIELVVHTLQEEGYSQSEIDSAVNWFLEREQSRPLMVGLPEQAQPLQSYRILHPSERMYIMPDAYGFLIQIRQLGLIDDLQLEASIDEALAIGWEVDVSLMKAIASGIIFDRDIDRVENIDHWAGFVVH